MRCFRENKQLGIVIGIVISAQFLMGQVTPQEPAPPLNQKEKPFEYRPIDPTYWFEVQEGLKDPNNTYVIKLSDQIAKRSKKDSLVGAEASVALAQGLLRDGFTFAATWVLSDIIKNRQGTQVSYLALLELERIVKLHPVDPDQVYGELIFDLDYDSPPKEVNDFVSYWNGFYNEQKGLKKWSDQDYKKVSLGSYWDFKLKYKAALEDLQAGRLDSSIERFASLSNNDLVPKDIKTDSAHQYARLVFEKGDYEQAYKVLRTVELNPRERGLILLERAWSKYYLKDYAKSLGLLTALEAPIFDPSRSPEAYILKMLIYKELCYYDAAFEVLQEFKKRFSQSIDAIKKRKDLRKDQMLVNLAVIDRRIGDWVNYLNMLKDERSRLNEVNFLSDLAQIRRQYDLKIFEVNRRLDLLLLGKIRTVANELLEWQEQISFLDYQTRVDSLRVTRPPDEVEFKAEVIPLTKFDKIYWTFTGEFWIDELESLKVFVESQCQKNGRPTP